MLAVTLVTALTALATLAAGCSDTPSIPATSDPEGKDLVEGAVVAAAESSGGYRLNKVLHVDDYPNPIGHQLHLVAYNPKAASYEEAARLWKKKESIKVALDHFEVRKVEFLKRDHRVLLVEPVTDAEKAPYLRSKESRKSP